MKNVPVTFLLAIWSVLSFAQNDLKDTFPTKQQLIGVWQEGSANVGDALKKNIQFFADGHFVINYSQYNEISPVRSLGGSYKVKSDGLYLNAEYRKEIVGGRYEPGNPGVESEEFIITGGKLEIIKQKPLSDSLLEPFSVSRCKPGKADPKHLCMFLNNSYYYKLSNNPKFYDK